MENAKHSEIMEKVDNIVNVALIDGGIQDTQMLENKIIESIYFSKYIQRKEANIEHGTTCAEIIAQMCPQVKFWDMRIFEKDGTANITILIEALKWCIRHRVKLIHLSLGTINYFDKEKLQEYIIRLTEQGAIIVAAYHNANIKTYPAIFKGVFGVYQDRKGVLKNYQFMFQNQKDISRENSLIAHWWDEKENIHSNSYAAPVITGYISRFLEGYPYAKFPEVLNFLQEHAESDVFTEQKIDSVLKIREDIDVPVICGIGFPCGVMKKLKEMFEVEGFQTLLLQDMVTDTTAVPISEYWKEEVSWKQIIYTAYKIYEKDIIFLDIQKKENYYIFGCDDIDIFIQYKNGLYLFDKKEVHKVSEMFHMICTCFQEQR